VYAVLIEVDVVGVERNAGLEALREHVVPAITHLPGFRSGTWLVGNEQGRGVSLTVWDSEENARAMAERFGGDGPAMPASVVRCEVREVAATA
jgi:heme-degrading monooxygenase HmoA